MGLGAAIGGISAIVGIADSVIGGNAASSAAQAQEQAAKQAAQVQLEMYQQTQQEEAPYIQAGNAALDALMEGLGFTQAAPGTSGAAASSSGGPNYAAQLQWLQQNTAPETQAKLAQYMAANPNATPEQSVQWLINSGIGSHHLKSFNAMFGPGAPGSMNPVTGTGGWQYSGTPGALDKPFAPTDLQNTPGYQFALQQGEDAVLNRASATVGIGGNTLKAITDYAEGLASTTYQQQLQDYMAQQAQQFNMLQTLSGGGQNAAANLGSLGSNAASNIGNALIGAGNAQSAGIVGGANAITGGINSLSSNFLNAALLGGMGGGGLFG